MTTHSTGSLPDLGLSADGLAARYPGQPASAAALADVTLHVRRGERVLLLGPNGAGKSTFLRVFAGLMRPTAGHATILGLPARRARHLVGIVAHATYLYEELTALENLRLFGDLYGVARLQARVDELLDRVGMRHLAREPVGRMSRGQQQRITIARALLHNPPILLLDEPDTGLDLAAFALLEDLALDGGRTVVLTSHNLAAGLRLGSRVVVLAHGRIVHEQDDASLADSQPLGNLLQQITRPARSAA